MFLWALPFILITGSMHYLKASSLPSSGWFGLFEEKDSSVRIRRTAIHAKRVPGVGDSEANEVESSPKGAIFLFNGVPGIREGSVHEAVWPDVNAELKKPGDEVRLSLDGEPYRIRLLAADARLRDAEVILEHGTTRQVLFKLEGEGGEPHFEILWAADIDRDGKLDLLVTLSGQYSGYPRQLFLSSFAKKGELVHEVAMFPDYSC